MPVYVDTVLLSTEVYGAGRDSFLCHLIHTPNKLFHGLRQKFGHFYANTFILYCAGTDNKFRTFSLCHQ